MKPETKIFISHATEDKDNFARPLADKLKTLCHVWYDEYSLPFGASIFGNISAGLNDCDYGVVVLSDSFFQKKWTQAEIAGLFSREEVGQRRIIPIWKEVSKSQVEKFSSILADRRAIESSLGVDRVVECIISAVDESSKQSAFVHEPQDEDPHRLFQALGDRYNHFIAVKAMNQSHQAPGSVFSVQSKLVSQLDAELTQIVLASPKFGISWDKGEFHCIPYDIVWFNVTLPNGDIVRLETTRPSRTIEGIRLDMTVFRPVRDEHGSFQRPDHLEDHRFIPELTANGIVLWSEPTLGKLDSQALGNFFLKTIHTHLLAIIEAKMSINH